MKKLLSLLLALAMLLSMLSMFACGAKEDDSPAPPPETTPAEDLSEPTAPVDTSAAVTPEESTAPETEPALSSSEETEPTTEAPPETEPPVTTATTPATEATTTTQEPEIKVSPMNAVMYAISDVNVRTGPSPDYERVGHLDGGDEVTVTGQAENGWYRIKFKDGEYFVSNSYLNTEKTTVATTATTPAPEPEPISNTKNDIWIATWSTATMPPDGPDKIPSNPKLDSNTVRQQIRVSAGGNKLRLVLSNEYGESALEVEDIRLAKLQSASSYYTEDGTEVQLTYNGATSFKVPARQRITLDVIDYDFDALELISITMKLGAVPKTLTCHTASRCTTWVVKGNHVSDNSYAKDCQKMVSWYFIAELDTMTAEDKGTIVCFGDSLTDGASIRENSFGRYSDRLADLLSKDEKLNGYGVAAMGIGATALYSYGGERAGTNRANRDILKVPGVKYVVLMMGINDIGGVQSDISQNIIREYESIIERCHKQGIKVIGMTLTPNKGSDYYSDLHEEIRLSVNKYIMSPNSKFDGYVDASSVVASEKDPAKLADNYVSDTWHDWLHFSKAGYHAVGDAVYEYLRDFIEKEK